MAWFKREPVELDTSGEKRVKTEGLWVKCDQCRQIIWKKDLDQNFNVCPKCERHFRIDARTRLSYLLDDMWTQMVKRGDGVLRLPEGAFELGGVLVERANAFMSRHPGSEDTLRQVEKEWYLRWFPEGLTQPGPEQREQAPATEQPP